MIRIYSSIFFLNTSLKFKPRTDFNHHLIVQSSSLDNDIFCLEASFFTIFFNKENWKGIAHHLLTINNNLLRTVYYLKRYHLLFYYLDWFCDHFFILQLSWLDAGRSQMAPDFLKIFGWRSFILSHKKLRSKLLPLLFHW